VIQQNLHAHADPHQRLVGGRMLHGGQHTRNAQLTHAVTHTPLPRQDHALSRHDFFGPARPNYLDTGALGHMQHGLRHRTQVAHAVVDHRHGS
jgi:hypothetical protein